MTDHDREDLSQVRLTSFAQRCWSWTGRYSIAVAVVLVGVAVSSILRLVLMAANADQLHVSVGQFLKLLLVGFSFDVFISLILSLPEAGHLTLYRTSYVEHPRGRRLFWGFVALQMFGLLFVCCAEWFFFDEFQSRLNYIAFEYLVYPHEVATNVWESYPVVPLVLALVTAAAAITWGLGRWVGQRVLDRIPAQRRVGLLVGHLLLIALLWPVVRFSNAQIGSNRVANELANNGLYSFGYYAWTCRYDYSAFYQTIADDEAVADVRTQLTHPGTEFQNTPDQPFDRVIRTSQPQRDWNVVVILEESFGSDFVGALGDKRGLSPELDKLTKDGLLFDNFYATGNRTARALEAVTASFPPIPTEAILKRDHSSHIYSIAHVLGERGYQRTFVSGGRGIFDGVRPFMLANGFEHFVEQKDYAKPAFVNAWGVSDEDTFHRAIDECDQLHDNGKPFFVTILTVSNHRPFTYPEGRIELSPHEKKRDNAVRYADWALGDFFERSRARPFFQNTMFVVLGDHGARVFGSQLFPMSSYRVPLLMIRPDGERAGERHSTLGCAMDVAPTILGVLGGDYRSVFFGQDMLSIPSEAGRAIMQHNHDLAWLDAQNRLFVLGLQHATHEFLMDRQTFDLSKQSAITDPVAMHKLTSLFQVADRLYYQDRQFVGGK